MRVGVTWDEWRAEHGEPLVLAGRLAVCTAGSITVDLGELCPLGAVIADYFERWPDAMGDRFVGRVAITVNLLATPEPPPGWVDAA
jgi:hypothetical protein